MIDVGVECKTKGTFVILLLWFPWYWLCEDCKNQSYSL